MTAKAEQLVEPKAKSERRPQREAALVAADAERGRQTRRAALVLACEQLFRHLKLEDLVTDDIRRDFVEHCEGEDFETEVAQHTAALEEEDGGGEGPDEEPPRQVAWKMAQMRWVRARLPGLDPGEDDPDYEQWHTVVHGCSSVELASRKIESRRRALDHLRLEEKSVMLALQAWYGRPVSVLELARAVREYREDKPRDLAQWTRKHLAPRLMAAAPAARQDERDVDFVRLERDSRAMLIDQYPPVGTWTQTMLKRERAATAGLGENVYRAIRSEADCIARAKEILAQITQNVPVRGAPASQED